MRQWAEPALVQVMACHLFGAKPLPEPVQDCCQLDSWEQIQVQWNSIGILSFSFKKMHLKLSSAKMAAILSSWREGGREGGGGEGGGGGGGMSSEDWWDANNLANNDAERAVFPHLARRNNIYRYWTTSMENRSHSNNEPIVICCTNP